MHRKHEKPVVFVLLLSSLLLSLTTWVHAEDSLHEASDQVLMEHACPELWETVNKVIAKPTSVPWKDTTDKEKFMLYQQYYFLKDTKTGSRSYESTSADIITVLSECVKRHNPIVDAEFNKIIGELEIAKKIPPGALMVIINYLLEKHKKQEVLDPGVMMAIINYLMDDDIKPAIDPQALSGALMMLFQVAIEEEEQ